MRFTRSFIATLKEAPKEATTPSHVLLLRGGFVRMIGAGLYEFLPLGMRVLHKVARIVRDEMDAAGALEVLMPALLPADYFRETGRWDAFGDTLLRLQDRKRGDYHLGPTHEEIITDMVRREVRSYRQLPVNLYQVQMKYRDEPRPRAGLLRCREFLMKDAYSFDVSEEAAIRSYEQMRDAYHRIFQRLGLDYRVVAADTGAMGGSTSAEFQVLAQNGEDAIVACDQCDYAANVEVAEARIDEAVTAVDPKDMEPRKKVETPGVKTIPEVVSFLKGGLRPSRTLKSLLYRAGDGLVLVVVRGDHEVNEIKLARHLGVDEVHLAPDGEVRQATGAEPGSVGPVGFPGKIVADHGASRVANAVVGANEADHHLINVNFGRDWEAPQADIRNVAEGDLCPRCGGTLKAYRGIEGGHIFVLGTHYSAKMGATFLDEDGTSKPVVMGCYGIGVSRLVAAAIEQYNDDDGIRWPMPIAPYQVLVAAIGKGDDVREEAERLHDALEAAGVEVLLDDRDERPGVKFKDADLLGIPLRVVVGAKALADGELELKARDQKEATRIPREGAVDHLLQRVVDAGGTLRAGR
jgi:prolyl-tRNA synthetase